MSTTEFLIASAVSFDVDEDFDFIALTEFAGYNPEALFVKIMEKVNDSEEKRLLQFIIFFGLLRGFGKKKTWKELEEKTKSTEGKKLLTKCRNHFGIVMNKDSPQNITIDRIMNVFPSLTHKAWRKICALGKGNMKLPMYVGNLPVEFRYPGSPSAMSTEIWNLHKANYIEWSVQLQMLWKVQNPDKQEIEKFAELQFQNSLFPMSDRSNIDSSV